MNDQSLGLGREKRMELAATVQIIYTTKNILQKRQKLIQGFFYRVQSKIKKISLLNSEDETVNLQNPIF